MRSILASDSAAQAYLVVAAADSDAREEARALLEAAGDDKAARAMAWAASAARNEAYVATVAALDLPPEMKPQVDKLIRRSRLVASLERMLSRAPGDSGRHAAWTAAVDARHEAALEMRRVLGIPLDQTGPTEEASALHVDLVFRTTRFRERVKRDIPAGLLTWCDWGTDPGRGRGTYVQWVVIGADDLGVPSLASFSYIDPDGPGRTGGNVRVDVTAGLDTGHYTWDPDRATRSRPKGQARYRDSDRTVRLDVKAVKILQPDDRLVVKGTITCDAP